MNKRSKPSHRILIASANSLFREGLHKVYAGQWQTQNVDVRMAQTMAETVDLMQDYRPDLVIVDHDDSTINRDEFLNGFINDELPMKVILVSLESSGPVVIYNREQLTADQAEEWLANPWDK